MYDVIIIGMGPAGMNAGVYAKRSGLKTLMLEKSTPGGVITKTNVVENYLGYETISGPDLAYKMFEHTQHEEIQYRIEEVERIIDEGEYKRVITCEEEYKTKTIIICGGRQPRKTDIENEESLVGKGLSYCAICDAPLYKGKKVAIIGGGNSAVEEGIYLSDIVSELYLLNRGEVMRADATLQEKLKSRKNVKILLNTKLKDVKLENDKIKSIITDKDEEIEVEGVFVYIGYEPVTRYLSELDIITSEGYVSVDENMCTKIKGIYAAGDIVKKELYQIITAASEGAMAAISAKKYISSIKEN